MWKTPFTVANGTTVALAFVTTIASVAAWNKIGNRKNNRPSCVVSTKDDDDDDNNKNKSEERHRLKAELKSLLSEHNGCTKQKDVVEVVEQLAAVNPVPNDCIKADDLFQGEFFTLSAPPFPGRIEPTRDNNDDDNNSLARFTLGRLSFNIFQPNNLVCTVKSITNPVFACTEKGDDDGDGRKFTYNIVVDITIHTTANGDGGDKDLDAIMINTGFCRASPDVNNRIMVTFTGSSLTPKPTTPNNNTNNNSVVDYDKTTVETMKSVLWTRQFEDAYQKADRERSYFGWMVHYGLKLFLGLTYPTDLDEQQQQQQRACFSFEMKKPLEFYIDVLYLDEDIRITKGSRGTIVVADRKQNE